MKKIYILAIAFLALTFVNAQVWDLGTDTENFPVGTGVGEAGSVTINGLLIYGTNANMGTVESGKKDFTSLITGAEYNFLNRFKFNGGGYSGSKDTDTEPTSMLPSQRYLAFDVTGDTDIYAIGVTGSNSSTRLLFVTDGTNLIGSIKTPSGGALTEGLVEYKGGATTLYLYCNAAINLYYLSATPSGPSVGVKNIENSAVVSSQYYNLSGVNVGSDFNSLSNGVYIKVDTFENGSKSSSKVIKN